MNKSIKITSANFFFMIFSILFLLAQIYLSISVAFGYGKELVDDVYLTVFITELVFILMPSLIFALANKIDVKYAFRINKPEFKPLLLIVLISFPAYMAANMLNTILVYLLQFVGKIPSNNIPVPKTIPQLLLGIIIISVLPAVCEEILNRGIMLRAYENRGTVKALVITGLFFGIFHFDITNFLGPAVLGAMLGFYAIRTNSIFAAMLGHFLNNTIAEIWSYIYRNEPSAEYIQVATPELLYSILIGVVCTLIVIYLLKVLYRITGETAEYKPALTGTRADVRSILTHYPVVVTLSIYIVITLLYLLMIIFNNANT